jgi:RNA 2',3'-cyclic 3'-phosphodiesterase
VGAQARTARSDEAPAPRPLRLFVAVDLPGEARDAVAAAVEPWRRAIPEARWGDRAGWHVTLKFLGDTPAEQVADVADLIAVAAAGVTAFETRLDGLGAFPVRGPARVLWVGLDDRPERLSGLALAIDASLAPRFEPEQRPLHPHVTVARLHPARRLPLGFVGQVVAPVTFTVGRVCLYRSHLGAGPARYELLAAAPLGTG